MDRKYLDKLAFENEKMPNSLNVSEKLYFQAVSNIYSKTKSGLLSNDEGKRLKTELIMDLDVFDTQYELFMQGAKIMNELNKLTAPFKELKDKTPEQLYSIICRMHLLNQGIIDEAFETIPDVWCRMMNVNPNLKLGG